MSVISSLEPKSSTYDLSNVFNYLNEGIPILENRLRDLKQSDDDMILLIASVETSIERHRQAKAKAKAKVQEWLDQGVEDANTDATFSIGNIPIYDHSRSVCEQILSGRLKPVI